MSNASDARNTDASPVTALVEGRGAFLGFLVKRLGNRAEAEDVLQEFCLRVLARKDQLREVDRMDAWLYAILRSTLNDHFRKSARRTRLAGAVAREPQEWVVDAPSQMARLCTCPGGLISDLRPSDAELIRRIDFGEEERGAVAQDLGLSRNALGVRLHRARAALRDALIKHCGDCCRAEGRDDCSCPPEGCENETHDTHCEADTRTA
ncbi:RNA polymerase sigma factor [Thiosulfatihalobacter marinus]|jgi:RNA polymerase sigma-70 factor (ECF subfamily)|uniref:RNA polymerase sigma factor n=1 Tax=Thiosulfatihalobacter marinus TaxID=2792481 RepID=UPI0018D64C07|nr:sigma-70 family RNA polymerase sigma factor [Thiosulfatihalobacter marinus]